jgi:hypothetical protein
MAWGAGFFPVPGKKFVKVFERVIGDAAQDIGEPSLRVDVVELGRLCRSPNYAERAPFSSGFVLIDV